VSPLLFVGAPDAQAPPRPRKRGKRSPPRPPKNIYKPTNPQPKPTSQDSLLSDAARIAAMRRADGAPEPKGPSPADGGGGENMLQGAASEARLITWPRPQKALLDTALVLGIVAGASALVFGLNVVLAETATAWYASR